MAEETIGFVGTGRMGGSMAGRLRDAGYPLSVYDTQSEATKPLVARGARLAKSPAEVASSADIVLTTRDYLAARQPNGRFIAMEAVAAMVVFLSSPAAQDITGAALPIDGGWSVA